MGILEIKEKMMHQNADTIKKWAIAGVIITIIVIFIFAMSLSDAKKFRERDICESASTITTVGNKAFLSKSINKSYTVYLIDSGSEYNFGKAKNTFYIVQQTDSGIKAYKVTNSIANKANILAYFSTVKEVNNLQITIIAGGLLAATIIVPMLLGLITVGLWFWWYMLIKRDKIVIQSNVTSTRTQKLTINPVEPASNAARRSREDTWEDTWEDDLETSNTISIVRKEPSTIDDNIIIARKDRIAANQTDDKSQISEPNLDIPVSKQTANKTPSYGLSPNDPICILSIPEEYSYINRLVCVSSDDMIVMRARIGSVGHKGVMLDKWDVKVRNKISGEIKKVVLFLNPYSFINDLKVPNGFRLSSKNNYYGQK